MEGWATIRDYHYLACQGFAETASMLTMRQVCLADESGFMASH